MKRTIHTEITHKVLAIITFGPPTGHMGMRPGEFYQVTLDPNMASPSGKYLRFDQRFQGGEVHGWQLIDGITVCEVLGDAPEYEKVPEGYEIDPDARLILAEIDDG